MTSPLISVVIPAYNSEKFISEAIESVLKQTLKDHEIIVVNDGSKDNTQEIIASYKSKIKMFEIDNSGSATARNVGWKNASGKWIAFLDADDLWDEDHLEKMVNCCKDKPDAALVYCGKRWIDNDGNIIEPWTVQSYFPDGWIFYELFKANYISSASTVMVLRDVLNTVGGFDERDIFRNAQDYDLWLRIAAQYKILSLPELKISYRRHENNKTNNVVSRSVGVLSAIKNALFMIKNGNVNSNNIAKKMKLNSRLKVAYNDYCRMLFSSRNYKECRMLAIESFKNNSFTKTTTLYLVLSSLPAGIIDFLKNTKKMTMHFVDWWRTA